jgi:ATP-dependent DNA ligase
MTVIDDFTPELLYCPSWYADPAPPLRRHGGDEWIMEPKLDGWRFIFHIKSDGSVDQYGRSGKLSYDLPDYLVDTMVALFPPDTVVDSELVADGAGRQSTDVSTILADHRAGTVTAYVFDVLAVGGIDTRDLPWNQRRWCIEQAFSDVTAGPVRQVVYGEPSLDLYRAWLSAGLEGAVLKRTASAYRNGAQNGDWIKLKLQKTMDLRITGLPKDGKGKYTGMVGAVEFELPNGQTGRASGMTDPVRQDMTDHPEKYLGRLAEFAYNKETRYGALLGPNYRRLRDDLEDA